MRPKLRIYMIGAYENQFRRFAPKTAPKRSWDGSSPYGILLYTWDKIRSDPWYAIPPNPTGCDKKDVTAFLLCCNAKKWRFRRPVFKVVFYKVVQPFHCGWAFLLPFFHSGAPALWKK